jgi:hypothetical protein
VGNVTDQFAAYVILKLTAINTDLQVRAFDFNHSHADQQDYSSLNVFEDGAVLLLSII